MINEEERWENEEERWEEVIKLAEKYGFLYSCYSGVAVLAIKEEQDKIKG